MEDYFGIGSIVTVAVNTGWFDRHGLTFNFNSILQLYIQLPTWATNGDTYFIELKKRNMYKCMIYIYLKWNVRSLFRYILLRNKRLLLLSTGIGTLIYIQIHKDNYTIQLLVVIIGYAI